MRSYVASAVLAVGFILLPAAAGFAPAEIGVLVRANGSNAEELRRSIVAHARVEEGRFRADLYFRLSEITVHLPTLSQRGEDVLVAEPVEGLPALLRASMTSPRRSGRGRKAGCPPRPRLSC